MDGNLWLWAWNGLPINTYISVCASTNRFHKEQGSRTNNVPSSIPHCTFKGKMLTEYINISKYEFLRKYAATKS